LAIALSGKVKTASSATVLSNLVEVIWLFWRSPMTLSLAAVYWMNNVRLYLEAEEPAVCWINERLIQAEQWRRQAGGKIGHIPDGVLLVPGLGGIWHPIDIEVQISKPSETEVRKVMADASVSGWENYPLRYYVSRKARGVVRATYEQMLSQREALQGEPFLLGPTFANLYHLGDPSSSPYNYGCYHNPTWTHFEQALSSTLYISR
jgi:hypothetical protein